MLDLEPQAQLSAGNQHTCSTGNTGQLWCWGDNYFLQLGQSLDPAPVVVPTRSTLVTTQSQRIFAGARNTCALSVAGELACWGDNGGKQLGHANPDPVPFPSTQPAYRRDVLGAALGLVHICASMNDGGVVCAGFPGYLGNDAGVGSQTPLPAEIPGPSVAISSSYTHTCAVTASAKGFCWGEGLFGQLGNGLREESAAPTEVRWRADAGIAAITVGTRHSCALTTNGGVWCWGENASQQLGDRSGLDTAVPTPVLDP